MAQPSDTGLTSAALARLLGVDEDTPRRWIRKGRIPDDVSRDYDYQEGQWYKKAGQNPTKWD